MQSDANRRKRHNGNSGDVRRSETLVHWVTRTWPCWAARSAICPQARWGVSWDLPGSRWWFLVGVVGGKWGFGGVFFQVKVGAFVFVWCLFYCGGLFMVPELALLWFFVVALVFDGGLCGGIDGGSWCGSMMFSLIALGWCFDWCLLVFSDWWFDDGYVVALRLLLVVYAINLVVSGVVWSACVVPNLGFQYVPAVLRFLEWLQTDGGYKNGF